MDTVGSAFVATPFCYRGIGRVPRVAPECGLLSTSQIWASNIEGKFMECCVAKKLRHSHGANSSFLTSRMPPTCRAKPRNTKKFQARGRVGGNTAGDDLRDFRDKEDPPQRSPPLDNAGAMDSGAEITASSPLRSISPTQSSFGDDVDATLHDMTASRPKIEENPPPLEKDDSMLMNASLANLDSKKLNSVGVNANDLMVMITETEKNNRILNEVQARDSTKPEEARSSKDAFKEQVPAFEAQLTEAREESKNQEKVKEQTSVLEGECNARLPNKVNDAARKVQTKLESPEEHFGILIRPSEDSNDKCGENKLSHLVEAQEIGTNMLMQPGDELQANPGAADQKIAGEQVSQHHASGSESLENSAKQMGADVKKRDAKEAFLAEEPRNSPMLVELATQGDPEFTNEMGVIGNQLQILQESPKNAEINKDDLMSTRAENVALLGLVCKLQEQAVNLKTKILDLEQQHQWEVETIRKSLGKVKAAGTFGAAQVPAGDMPWEFWSELLLRIDALQLGKEISREDAQELREMAWRRESSIRDKYAALQKARDADLLAGLAELTKRKKRPGYYVVHIAAEMAPVAKVGGLGDVVTGLGKALQKKGHLVEIILPKYDCMDYSRIKDLKVLDVELYSSFDHQTHKNKIWIGIVEGLPVYFIEPYHHARFFWRGQFYGENDDFRRFTYFCRAALEFLLQSGKRPDMIHNHDWQTAAVAPLYWDNYVSQGLDSARLAFTCHNFEYQGIESPAALASCGLNVQQLHRQDRMQDDYNYSQVNLLKAGVVFSNFVTTVSPTYAQEARAPEGGRGLHLTLAHHSKKFVGILNGIDDEAWNPATDQLLPFQFSADDLGGKVANKSALKSRLRLASTGSDEDRPLVAVITRLVPQKGVHLIRHAIYRTLELGGQFVLLGSSPIPSIQSEFEGIAKDFENHPHIRLVLKYDEGLSHSIYAASDLFVIPSIFEPCGLTQMVSMRYGSIPVVRKTGGLADSVFDVDDPSIPEEKKNGFTFSAPDVDGLNYALDRALDYHARDKAWWEKLVKKAMKLDYSWDLSADRYVDLYRQCIERAKVHG